MTKNTVDFLNVKCVEKPLIIPIYFIHKKGHTGGESCDCMNVGKPLIITEIFKKSERTHTREKP